LLLAISLAPGSAAATPVGDCRARLDGAPDGAAVDLDARCPGLFPWLRARGYQKALQPPPGAIDTAGGARAALRLLPADAPASSRPVDRAALEQVVSGVRRANSSEETAPGWWTRFQQWLKAKLDNDDWQAPAWFDEIEASLGFFGPLVRWLGYGLLVAASGALVWSVGRWLRRHAPAWPRSRHARETASPHHAGADPRLADVRARALRKQPVLLLRLVIAALQRQQVLPRAPGKTDTELAAALGPAEAEPRARFARVAACAQRTRYANQPPTTDELERCVADALALIGERGA